MNISFTGPLDRAWVRMKLALFNPFDLGKWFVLGFTAWLAALSGGGTGGGTGGGPDSSLRFDNKFPHVRFDDWADGTDDAVREFFSQGMAGLLIAVLVVVGLVLAVVALWLGSRGKFMFLDNLVHGRAEVRRPWREFKAQGDALFVWQVVFTVTGLVLLGVFAVAGFAVFVPLGAADGFEVLSWPLAVVGGIIAFVVAVFLGYVQFFLNHFVVTIMYRERIGVNAAWSRFLVLLRTHPGSFVVYGLFYLLIMIVGWLIFAVAGALTCCVGLLLLALPYIGAVVTLPLSTLVRFWDLEFLAQFGADFDLLDRLTGATEPSPPAPSVTALTAPVAESAPLAEPADPDEEPDEV